MYTSAPYSSSDDEVFQSCRRLVMGQTVLSHPFLEAVALKAAVLLVVGPVSVVSHPLTITPFPFLALLGKKSTRWSSDWIFMIQTYAAEGPLDVLSPILDARKSQQERKAPDWKKMWVKGELSFPWFYACRLAWSWSLLFLSLFPFSSLTMKVWTCDLLIVIHKNLSHNVKRPKEHLT